MRRRLAALIFVALVSDGAGAAARAPAATPDPEANRASLELGMIGSGTNNGVSYFAGVGARFARDIDGSVFFDGDYLALEGGLYFYRVLGYVNAGDAYDVVPLSLAAQYGYRFANRWRAYLYVGAQLSVGISESNAHDTSASANALSGMLPAVGVGVAIPFKRVWFARADGGTDFIGAGLGYEF